MGTIKRNKVMLGKCDMMNFVSDNKLKPILHSVVKYTDGTMVATNSYILICNRDARAISRLPESEKPDRATVEYIPYDSADGDCIKIVGTPPNVFNSGWYDHYDAHWHPMDVQEFVKDLEWYKRQKFKKSEIRYSAIRMILTETDEVGTYVPTYNCEYVELLCEFAKNGIESVERRVVQGEHDCPVLYVMDKLGNSILLMPINQPRADHSSDYLINNEKVGLCVIKRDDNFIRTMPEKRTKQNN